MSNSPYDHTRSDGFDAAPDAGQFDAGQVDAGQVDAGQFDAGQTFVDSPVQQSAATASTKDVAAAEAQDLSRHVGSAGQDLKDRAGAEAGSVVRDARSEVRGLLDSSRDELRGQTRGQQQRLASGVRSVSDELRQMADSTDGNGTAGKVTQQLAGTGHDLADWLDRREPEDVLDEVRRFASRRPLAFLGIAAGAGLLVGRFARGVRDDRSEDDQFGSRRQGDRLPAAPRGDEYSGTDLPRDDRFGEGHGFAAGSGYAEDTGHTSGPDPDNFLGDEVRR